MKLNVEVTQVQSESALAGGLVACEYAARITTQDGRDGVGFAQDVSPEGSL